MADKKKPTPNKETSKTKVKLTGEAKQKTSTPKKNNSSNNKINTNTRLDKIKAKAETEKKLPTKTKKAATITNKKLCPLNFVITALGSFIFIFIFEFVWHGIILIDFYTNTPNLWRSSIDMPYYAKFAFLTQISLAFLLTFIYSQNYHDNNLATTLKFGFFAGLLIAIVQTAPFAYMPIPGELAFLWFIGSMIQILGVSLIIASILKKAHG